MKVDVPFFCAKATWLPRFEKGRNAKNWTAFATGKSGELRLERSWVNLRVDIWHPMTLWMNFGWLAQAHPSPVEKCSTTPVFMLVSLRFSDIQGFWRICFNTTKQFETFHVTSQLPNEIPWVLWFVSRTMFGTNLWWSWCMEMAQIWPVSLQFLTQECRDCERQFLRNSGQLAKMIFVIHI